MDMLERYQKEEDDLTDAVNNGEISDKEYHQCMRDLRNEMREGAEEAAAEAYDNYFY